ncbi:MAG: hypothetical protein EPN47_06000 [Acidobacteria bacterium]|nr:MAG: hypothetical protein EPN47_06000 [Acidobacteriota bacterium]
MAASLTEFVEALQNLITKFENDKAYYLSKNYPETQARIGFIDPLFRALGWDIENQVGLSLGWLSFGPIGATLQSIV